MPKSAKAFVTLLVVTAVTGGCITTRTLNMDIPPYSTVVNGIKPDMSKLNANLPHIAPGVYLAYFVTSTNFVNIAVMDNPITQKVEGAERSRSLNLNISNYDIISKKHVSLLEVTAIHDEVGVSKASTTVELSRHKASIETKSGSIDIKSTEGLHDIDTLSASTEISSDKHGLNIATPEEVQNMQVGTDSMDIESPTEVSNIDTISADSAVSFKADQTEMSQTKESDTTGISDKESIDMQFQEQESKFGTLDENMGILVDSDFDVIKVLRDQFIIDGFYQNDVLHEGGENYEITLKEEQEFLSLLRSQATIDQLLNRPYSRRFRKEAEMEPANLVLTARFISDRAKHHGQQLLMSLQITNNGTLPAYDILMLNRLPAHTAFERFPIVSTRNSGFLHNFNRETEVMAFRLYRPLMPGESFKTSIMLRLDRWDTTARIK